MSRRLKRNDRASPPAALLAERKIFSGKTNLAPALCPSPDRQGFLVARSLPADPPRDQRSIERHGPPWEIGPTVADLMIGENVECLRLDKSGRYLAVVRAKPDPQLELWDLPANKLLARVPHIEPITWVGFTEDSSLMISLSSSFEHGCVSVTSTGGGDSRHISLCGAKRAAVHPTGDLLVVAGSDQQLSIVNLKAGCVENQMIAPFGDQVVREYFEAASTQPAFRRQMRDARKVFKTVGVPPEVGSLNDFMKQFESDYREKLREDCDLAVKNGPPGGILCMEFDPSGEQLLLGTMAGLRGFSWRDMASRNGSLPDPTIKEEMVDQPLLARTCDGYVYDLEFDPTRSSVLLACGDGRVRIYDFSSSRLGVLVELTDLPPIHQAVFSLDRTALALVLRADTVSRPSAAIGPVLQVWDYPSLAASR